ncbi:hypothetical protein BpHYR1_052135 [Brachionus plicatilis]|uniref:Uncharacterized protein n=1 Tax=Brachionus plicatilis TaxID=10195 RepID=A0A3M7RQZ7_BRAPC|nr:hypothetical protein BpHYR1_052135 [Brachionus plicatilis]
MCPDLSSNKKKNFFLFFRFFDQRSELYLLTSNTQPSVCVYCAIDLSSGKALHSMIINRSNWSRAVSDLELKRTSDGHKS